jgi:hypothetical protein
MLTEPIEVAAVSGRPLFETRLQEKPIDAVLGFGMPRALGETEVDFDGETVISPNCSSAKAG